MHRPDRRGDHAVVPAGSVDDECTVLHARLPGFFQIKQIICVLMKELGLYDLTPALCRLDYTMSEAGGVTNFERQYTLASGGPYCDCGYKKKEYRKTISHLPRSMEQEPHAQQDRKEDQVG